MKTAIRKGLGFGVTSGVITTLGLMIGLTYSTQLKIAVIGGVITIAIADALSDALGVHISEESEKQKSQKQVWAATFSTAFYKFIIALTFIIPILLFNLTVAISVSIVWGAILIGFVSVEIANRRGLALWRVIGEHYFIAALVIIVTYFLGKFVGRIFI